MLATYLAPIVSICGALVYGLSGNSKAAELGKYAFACGLLITLVMCGGHSIKLP